ncbi:MAG: hypothetical protein WD407_01270 [Rhodospirillales bacterium]
MPRLSNWKSLGTVGFFLAAMIAAAVVPVQSAQYATSKSPYWRVGDVNEKLSSLCQRRLFNQVSHLQWHIGYIGGPGKGVTGIAKKGWNLSDPTNVGVPGITYHFFNDGYSNCKVYTAGQATR